MLRTGGPGLDNPGCVAYVVSLDTELTQKVPFPCRENKKKKRQVWCAQPVCLSLSFFCSGGERQLHRHKCTTCWSFLSYSLFLPSPLQYLRQLLLLHPVHESNPRQTFTNQLCKVLHPYLPPETNIYLCLAQVPLQFQLFGYIILKAFLTS